jgi:hypothetical protein
MSAAAATNAPLRKVLVLSYLNYRNFGDRLGFHVVNTVLPANAVVTHLPLNAPAFPDESFDLLILGVGHSLNAPSIARPEIQRLVETTPKTLGIFGTQYPYQYREMIDPLLFGKLLDRMTIWWARNRSDVETFGGGRANVRHLGDWLISAFPMTTPRLDKTLTIGADVVDKEVSLDRVIQRIQAYRRVSSARIHPLLCALTSADQVRFQEQREAFGLGIESGKFTTMLTDIFGRAFDEDVFFAVDRNAVLRYKLMVEANMAELRGQIRALLEL